MAKRPKVGAKEKACTAGEFQVKPPQITWKHPQKECLKTMHASGEGRTEGGASSIDMAAHGRKASSQPREAMRVVMRAVSPR